MLKLKKLISSVIIISIFTLVGCEIETPKKSNDKIDDRAVVEQKINKEEIKLDYDYKVEKKLLEIKDKNIKIYYPQIKDYPGMMLMDYMNQSLSEILNKYGKKNIYSDVNIDYEITKMDNKVLSILFKGTANIKGIGKKKIQKSVNLDLKTSNEINYDNLIKNDEKSIKEIRKILDEKAKQQGIKEGLEAEGISIYFKGEDIVFYYMPLDDSAEDFIELSVPKKNLEKYMNIDFGKLPAS